MDSAACPLKNCPEFQNGCPYSNDKEKLEHFKECPEFQKGNCPFDSESDHKINMEKWKDCPHSKEHGCPYNDLLEGKKSTE